MRQPVPPVAELEGATKRYEDVVALDGVDLRIESGQCIAVLGPNGAGKTTANYAQLSWTAVGMPSDSLGASIAWLVAYGEALFAAAAWTYRRARREEAGR